MRRRLGGNSQIWNKSERVNIIHLRKHLHLTNCIHLKYRSHMQRLKMKLEQGNPSETSLIRELSTLKKSRSLRDPSTSPSWKSGSFLQKFERNRRKDGVQLQGADPQTLEGVDSLSSRLGVSATLSSVADAGAEGDESSEQEGWVEISPEDGKHLQATHTFPHQSSHISSSMSGQMYFISKPRTQDSILQNWSSNNSATELLNAIKLRNSEKQDGQGSFSLRIATENQGSLKDDTLSKGDYNLGSDKDTSATGSDSLSNSKSDTRGSSPSGRRLHELLTSAIGPKIPSQYRMNWSSTLLDRSRANKCTENDELEISEMPHNGCGVPWNWSKVHTRGKNLPDISERHTTSGPSELLARRLGKTFSKWNVTSSEESLAMTSEFSDTSLNTDSESFPLLKHGAAQSDIGSPSEGGQGESTRTNQTESTLLFPGVGEIRHLGPILRNENHHHTISEKFAPKSFGDIVGQGLITQALSNALLKRKIASIYIFHGPQGTGKTSCARLFALALNCTAEDKPKPCGSCSECLAQNLGKASTVKEFAASRLLGVKGMKKIVHEVATAISSHYRVFIMDECHILSTQSWNAFMKAIEEAPKNVTFILCTSNLEQVPHAVMSRGQKFMFSKIREIDIVSRLQLIAIQEGLELDAEALRLVASACDGSLRDAEMMLDQLSLLGQNISLSMVQELMGLVSDEKLVELLDFALSADTVNTVRSFKDLMVSGVEPLNLMSQLACLITSLLAGTYQIPKARCRRKFFRKKQLAREDMERLRQALKTLSEAEKQLRASTDRTTWLTAALLQFAPDHSYLLPSSSVDTSFAPSPEGAKNRKVTLELNPLYSRVVELQHQQCLKTASGTATEDFSNDISSSPKVSASDLQQAPSTIPQKKAKSHKQRVSESGLATAQSSSNSGEADKKTAWQTTLTNEYEIEELWQRVLDVVHSTSLRKFLQTKGKLLSVSICKGFAVATLEFAEPESTSRAERSRTSIAHAFQTTLGCPIDVKVQRVSKDEGTMRRLSVSGDQPSRSSGFCQLGWSSGDGKAYSSSMSVGKSGQLDTNFQSLKYKKAQSLDVFRGSSDHSKPLNVSKPSNVNERNAAETGGNCCTPPAAFDTHTSQDKLENAWVRVARDGTFFTQNSSKAGINQQEGAGFRQNSSRPNRVSLGLAIQQTEGSVDEYSRDVEFDHMNEGSSFHLRHNAGYEGTTSEIAARLEEENLRLESRSRGLCCWKQNDKGKEHEESPEPKRSSFVLNLCPCSKSG